MTCFASCWLAKRITIRCCHGTGRLRTPRASVSSATRSAAPLRLVAVVATNSLKHGSQYASTAVSPIVHGDAYRPRRIQPAVVNMASRFALVALVRVHVQRDHNPFHRRWSQFEHTTPKMFEALHLNSALACQRCLEASNPNCRLCWLGSFLSVQTFPEFFGAYREHTFLLLFSLAGLFSQP